MKVIGYPVAHFNLMADLATRLSSKSIQLLEHNYTSEAFGSWWLSCKSSGHEFRVVFDGRDYLLAIQEPMGKDWSDIASHPARDSNPAEIVAFIVEALKRV